MAAVFDAPRTERRRNGASQRTVARRGGSIRPIGPGRQWRPAIRCMGDRECLTEVREATQGSLACLTGDLVVRIGQAFIHGLEFEEPEQVEVPLVGELLLQVVDFVAHGRGLTCAT